MMNAFFKEFTYRHYSSLVREENKISFELSLFDTTYKRYGNKYGYFSEGSLEFKEKGDFIVVVFNGNPTRGFLSCGIFPTILFAGILVSSFFNYENLRMLIIPIFFWTLGFIVSFVFKKISMSFYISGKVNRIKENLRDGQTIS